MRYLLLNWIVLFTINVYAQINLPVVPIVQQGQWKILRGQELVTLERFIQWVSPFDEVGLAVYSTGEQYGVLNQFGVTCHPLQSEEINAFGGGWFTWETDSGTIVYSIPQQKEILCQHAEKINANWIKYQEDSSIYLLNSHWNSPRKYSISNSIAYTSPYYLVLKINKNVDLLFNDKGEVIDSSNAYIDFNYNEILYVGKQEKFYQIGSIKNKLPPQANNCSMSNKYIEYNVDNLTELIEKEGFKKIVSFPCDDIYPYKNFFIIRRTRAYGLLDQHGKQILPLKFNRIEERQNLLFAYAPAGLGVFDQSGKELIPCQFFSIQFDGIFFRTRNFGSGNGLISAKTFQELLPPIYQRILFLKPIIKAYNRTDLTILQLSETHQIESKIIIPNAVSSYTPTNLFKTLPYDTRLFSQGWFTDTIEIHDSLNRLVNYNFRIGLKNELDSVLIKPNSFKPIYVPELAANLILVKEAKFNYLQEKIQNYYKAYQFLSVKTGRINSNYAVVHFDSTDFYQYEFARFVHLNGHGIIYKNGQIKAFSFIDSTHGDFTRYCFAKQIEFIENNKGFKDKEIVKIPNWYDEDQKITLTGSRIKFEQAQWNFLDKNGDSLFHFPIYYAENFYKKTAIIRGQHGWGVVNRDSCIIPTIYANIQRISELDDTFFLVKTTTTESIYLDSNLQAINLDGFSFEKSIGTVHLFLKNKQYWVMDDHGNWILKQLNNVKAIPGNLLIVKEKKQYAIYDFTGNLVLTSKSIPLKYLGNNALLIEQHGKKGILSLQADTLLPCQFDAIEVFDSLYLTKQSSVLQVVNFNFEPIYQTNEHSVLIDSISQQWMVWNGKTVAIYSLKNSKSVEKWKLDDAPLFYFNHLIFTKSGHIWSDDGKIQEQFKTHKSVTFFEKGYLVLVDENQKQQLINPHLEILTNSALINKNVIYYGDEIFSCKSKRGFIIIDGKTGQSHFEFEALKMATASDQLLIQKNGSWKFYDRNFIPILTQNFQQAHVFKAGLAPVSFRSGWTLITTDGKTKSLNSFPPIKRITTNLYLTQKIPNYGIIDSKGKVIIEPIYEKITILNSTLIQAVKEGELYYFDVNKGAINLFK